MQKKLKKRPFFCNFGHFFGRGQMANPADSRRNRGGGGGGTVVGGSRSNGEGGPISPGVEWIGHFFAAKSCPKSTFSRS